MKSWLIAYFSFSKREFNGIMVLFALILLICFSPYFYGLFKKEELANEQVLLSMLDELKFKEENALDRYNDERGAKVREKRPIVYADFDPNALDATGWQRLGLSEKQAKVIMNYRAKGGRFYKKEDVEKMYTISAETYAKLEPYIKIKEQVRESAYDRGDNAAFSRPVKKEVMVELNGADSATLITIRGIGPVFASRMIKYRDRLGGFHNKEQLREVFGIDSGKFNALVPQVSVDPLAVKKININTVSFDELKLFPYLSYKQMNAIIQYRKQHGEYLSVSDLKKIAILGDETLAKLAPYIIFR